MGLQFPSPSQQRLYRRRDQIKKWRTHQSQIRMVKKIKKKGQKPGRRGKKPHESTHPNLINPFQRKFIKAILKLRSIWGYNQTQAHHQPRYPANRRLCSKFNTKKTFNPERNRKPQNLVESPSSDNRGLELPTFKIIAWRQINKIKRRRGKKTWRRKNLGRKGIKRKKERKETAAQRKK